MQMRGQVKRLLFVSPFLFGSLSLAACLAAPAPLWAQIESMQVPGQNQPAGGADAAAPAAPAKPVPTPDPTAATGGATTQQMAPSILPTANKARPATPTSQPKGMLTLGGKGASAAPSTQPVIPKQPGMNEGLGSIQTQIEALPLPGVPDVKSPAAAASSEQALEEKQPYLPPELRQKVSPDSNMMLPPLYGWSRIVLHDLQMPRQKGLADSCGMKKDFIFQFFAQRLQEGGIPVMNEEQASRLIPEQIKVEARPIIVSMEDLVINCTSWVQFQITAEMIVRVPPMMYRRRVPILLWHDGMLVTSAKSTHNGALINAFISLAMRFRSAWDAQQALVDPTKLVK